ncbi:unnamed protein product [Rotaria sp. Silwood1]|nr:unnamed protein product [Rotaria sp. Silwood1]
MSGPSQRDEPFRSQRNPSASGASSSSPESIIDPAAFELYTRLKKVAKDYNLESKLQIPQLVMVGETSVGKSMLVQYFLRFPCSFSQANVATRCPVAYRLHYNPRLNDREIKIVEPVGLTPQKLADHLADYMKQIEITDGFRLEPHTIELESKMYSDFEILDIPGLVGGERDEKYRKAVERITEAYVRNRNFMIVQLREAHQPLVNANGMLTIYRLCTSVPAEYNRDLPPRLDYRDHTVVIHTKFNIFMSENTNAGGVNNLIEAMKTEYGGKTYFTNMIFDGYTMSDHSYVENVKYIADLPELEKKNVDEWIEKLNQLARTQPSNFEFFNQQNRSLIGIDIVRTKIQELWIKAIRSALPDLKVAIYEQLVDARQRHNAALKQLQQQNPKTLKTDYTNYINDFHSVFTSYINMKSETDIPFSYNKCSKTYAHIEFEYEQWKRRILHTWRAYLSYKDMKQLFTDTEEYGDMLNTLDCPLVGARHFHRLEQVFKAMIYTFKPRELTRGEIETAESHIAYSISTGENLEKATRELVRSLIRDTFLIGICWLTQMYTFLCDMLQNDVTKYLLFTASQYPQLRNHFRFLHCVELSYHKTVRAGVRESLQLIKLARNASTSYITHDVTANIKKLAYSIPAEIKHKELNRLNRKMTMSMNDNNIQENNQTRGTDIFEGIPPAKIQSYLYASESYLTADRNPQTANHHDHGRRVILEMYSAVRGQLIQIIIAAFNTSLLIKLHEFNTIRPDIKSLYGRLLEMSDQKIVRMADVKFDEIRKELDKIEAEIIDLENVLFYIDKAMKQSISGEHISTAASDNLQQNSEEENNARKQQLTKKRKLIEKELPKLRLTHHGTNTTEEQDDESNGNDDDEMEDYVSQLIKSQNKIEANQLLANIYKEEDSQDMEAAFLKGDSLDADKHAPKAQRHLDLVADRTTYDAVDLPPSPLSPPPLPIKFLAPRSVSQPFFSKMTTMPSASNQSHQPSYVQNTAASPPQPDPHLCNPTNIDHKLLSDFDPIPLPTGSDGIETPVASATYYGTRS